MARKLLNILLVIFLVLPIFGKTNFIFADEEDEEVSEVEELEEEEVVEEKSDRDKCLEDGDRQACTAIRDSVSSELKDLNAQIRAAQENEEKARELAAEFESKAYDTQIEIEQTRIQIEELKIKIAELEVQIAENEQKVDELNSRVKNRMVEYQKTMHFNGYLEFILGSKSFTDMLRRIYGVESITSKDKADRQEYAEVIAKLNADKEELDESKKQLDEKCDELIVKQIEFEEMKQFYLSEIEKIEAELDALTQERNRVEHFTDDPEIKEALQEAGILVNDGFVAAVHGSYITEGVWHYSDGFLDGTWHTGVDYAASYGTALHAPAGGVIIRADDGCSGGNDSYSCGEWISGGGNQVYLLAEVDGVVYGFMFFHLSRVSVSKGDIVDQDEIIGAVGDTGHSYGAHCHIEMYKLGYGSLEEIAGIGWDSTFGLHRHEILYDNRCSVKSAPCICDPRDYLPG